MVRFRSAPGDPKDIVYVFMALAGGFACGRGYVTYGIFFIILICVFMILLSRLGYGKKRMNVRKLRIKIPENLNYTDAFDDILKKYTKNFELEKIKTIDLGALFELTYHVTLSTDINEKEFIDELRCRNGNLTILLTAIDDKTSFKG